MLDHRLHVLRVVAERGTVTGAAEALRYSPSAVSHQLRSLARDLGVTLLERDGRGVRLTSTAHLLLEHADGLFQQWEQVRSDLAAAEPDRPSLLRLCGFSTAAAALLPHVAAQLQQEHPGYAVRIIEADPEECFELLLADVADLAVVAATPSLPPRSDPRFDQASLTDDPLDLLVSADHPLARRSSVHLREAADEPWIMDRPDRPLHGLVLAACNAAGFTPTIAHEVHEWDAGAALVEVGLGVCLVPRLARLPATAQTARIPLRGDPTPARHLLTCVRRGSRDRPSIAAALAALEVVADRRTERVPDSAPPEEPHR